MSLNSAEFLEGLAGAEEFLTAAAKMTMHEVADRIADRARQFAPVGDDSDPHAGQLRDDIGIKGEGVDTGMPYVDVGSTVPEAVLEEYGTTHSDAHPFMRPALAMEGS